MKIDIYIPTFNRKDLLRKAIKSALLQTYKDKEIIISDNASTDGTHQMVLEEFGEYGNIKYFKQEENIGPFNNFKKCIYEYGSAKFCIFLSDDDELIDPNYITLAAKKIEEHSNLAIVSANTQIEYTDLGITFTSNQILPEIIPGLDFLRNYGTKGYSITWCNAIFRRDLAITLDCYNGNIFYVDSDCFFRLMGHGDVCFLKNIASLYRIHSSNSYKKAPVETYIKNEEYILRNYTYLIEIYPKLNIELDVWKNRLISAYRIQILENIILFSDFPFKYSCIVLKNYYDRSVSPRYTSYFRLACLLLLRPFLKSKKLYVALLKIIYS